MTGQINPDRLAALEEERAFLLRSLADLEREHDAGDIADDDYQTLKDDYTMRAAQSLRAVREGRAALPARRPMSWRKFLIGVGACAVAAVAIGWLLTRATSDRRTGELITGEGPPATDVNSLLVNARSLDPLEAVRGYEAVLKRDADNVEALTYLGWNLAIVAFQTEEGPNREVLVTASVKYLDQARAADPSYVDAQCFTAIVRFRFQNDAEGAKGPLDLCRAGELPGEVEGLVSALGDQVEEALAPASATSDPADPTPATTES